MSSPETLVVSDLHASAGGKEILHGVNLEIGRGEVHVVMGPNGSGKSTLAHALMGRPGTTVTAGSIRLGDEELVGLAPHLGAKAGLFIGLQHPIEVPGVRLDDMLVAAGAPRATINERLGDEADSIGLARPFLERALNVDLSGGERKRNETLQLAMLRPAFCVLDEIDSGLDVDALGAVSRRIETATTQWGLGVLAITHFHRLLKELHADVIHVLIDGRIVTSGGPELAQELEVSGYAAWGASPD